jgi:hypothetical protein
MNCDDNWMTENGKMEVAPVLLLLILFSYSTAIAEDIGYDANTEIAVVGKVLKSSSKPYKGYNTFYLKNDVILFKVITAPPWFMRQTKFKPKSDSKLKVVGSKFYGNDGSVCLIARKIQHKKTGKSILLRDRRFKPVWNVKGVKKSSCIMVTHPKP